jgi:sarcosine oxidase subunit gamma
MDDATVARIETGSVAVLRLFRPTDDEIAAASARLGFALAVEPLRLADHAAPNARIGPGEWIILGRADDLSGRLDGMLHDLSHVGHARTRWRLNERAAELLQRGCSLDLDPTVFTAGACTRTLLAQAPVLILRASVGPELDVIGDNSLSDYLEAWLEDAAAGIE